MFCFLHRSVRHPLPLAPSQCHQEKSPGTGGDGGRGQPGGSRTSSSQELRSLLCEARSPEPRDEIKLRSFPISSERRVCSSCRQSQKMSE